MFLVFQNNPWQHSFYIIDVFVQKNSGYGSQVLLKGNVNGLHWSYLVVIMDLQRFDSTGFFWEKKRIPPILEPWYRYL